jgi:RNA polymerase sigma factor (sigma-70 family)
MSEDIAPERVPVLDSLKKQGLVQKTVEALSLEQKTILKLRYGVLQDDELTLRDIGEILGLSRERVRQIESRAEAKCRRSVRRGNVRQT